MKKFLLIAAATLIAGAATMAFATDHKGSKKHAAAPSAPAKNPSTVAASRSSVHKTTPARHPAKKHKAHHPVHHAKK